MSSATLNLDTDQLKALVELLAGAAWADDQFHGLEADAITAIIAEHADNDAASETATAHLEGFGKDDVDVSSACERLGLDSTEARSAVISLIARVTDADFTHDFAESDYIESVASALGLDASDYRAHTVEEIKVAFSIPKPN